MGFSIFGKSKIKIGFLISYDYKYIYDALKIVYDLADEIILAIDVNRNTWVGQKIDLPDAFFETVRSMDPDNKIVFFEDDFFIPTLGPMENEVRERNMISEKMGNDCWKLQIDSDEYFLDFAGFCAFLQKNRFLLSNPNLNQLNIRAYWITLFKKTENGFLYIYNDETVSIATNVVGKHFFGRNLNAVDNGELQTNFRVLHQSWAREPEEIHKKIHNWGHKNDFDSEAYFDFWMNVDEHNYTEFTNLHPVYPKDWKALSFIACTDIHDFIKKFNAKYPEPKPSKMRTKYFKRFLKNLFKTTS